MLPPFPLQGVCPFPVSGSTTMVVSYGAPSVRPCENTLNYSVAAPAVSLITCFLVVTLPVPPLVFLCQCLHPPPSPLRYQPPWRMCIHLFVPVLPCWRRKFPPPPHPQRPRPPPLPAMSCWLGVFHPPPPFPHRRNLFLCPPFLPTLLLRSGLIVFPSLSNQDPCRRSYPPPLWSQATIAPSLTRLPPPIQVLWGASAWCLAWSGSIPPSYLPGLSGIPPFCGNPSSMRRRRTTGRRCNIRMLGWRLRQSNMFSSGCNFSTDQPGLYSFGIVHIPYKVYQLRP